MNNKCPDHIIVLRTADFLEIDFFQKISFRNTFRLSNGLTSWLSFVVSSVSLSLSHWYPGSGVVLDCIDS